MEMTCVICGNRTEATEDEIGSVRGNTARFRHKLFRLWKCPNCLTIHSIDPVDLRDIYRDYPLTRRRLDVFARGTFHSLLERLAQAGLEKTHRILDYGCGNGLFLAYLRDCGYSEVVGYDPYVNSYAAEPEGTFDCVIANDVIEHVPNPRATIQRCAALVRTSGILYIGTADSEPVAINDLDPHIMRLHQPFHRVIVTAVTLERLAGETGFELLQSYRRSYMDSLRPFVNYRFLDELNQALGHDLDRAFQPDAGKALARNPRLWFFAFFGYFFPSANEPAVVLRKACKDASLPI